MDNRGFNSDYLFEIDTNPGGTEEYVRIGKGIADATHAPNDVTSQKAYFTDNGLGSTSVDGMQNTYSLSGDRILNDAAQNFIIDACKTPGNSRYTSMKITDGNGENTKLNVTLVSASGFGGAANAPSAFTAEIHQNGEAEITPASEATVLEATASLTGGKVTISANPAIDHVIRYTVTGAVAETPNQMSSLLGGIIYNGPFNSTAGKYVNIYECKYKTKIVAFVSVLLG